MARLFVHYVSEGTSNDDSGGEYYEHHIDALTEASRRAWQWCNVLHPSGNVPVITKVRHEYGDTSVTISARDIFNDLVVYTVTE